MVSKPFWWIVASRTACFGYPIAPRYFRDFKPTLRGAKSLSWKNTDGERELHHFIILSMKIRHEFMVIWGHLRCFPDNFCFIFQLSSWLVGTWHSAFMFFLRRWSRLRKDRRWMRWSSLWYLNEYNPLPFKPEVRLVHLQDARVLKCFHVFSIYILHYTSYIFIILFKIWILRPNFILTVLCAFHLRWLCNVGLCSRLKNRNLHFPNGNFWIPKSLSAICSGDFSLILSKVSGIPGRELPPPPPPARKTKWTCSACGTMNFETWTIVPCRKKTWKKSGKRNTKLGAFGNGMVLCLKIWFWFWQWKTWKPSLPCWRCLLGDPTLRVYWKISSCKSRACDCVYI